MKKRAVGISSSTTNILLYLAFFIPMFVIIACFWYFFVDGVLYYCSDKVPFIDLLPPFVHEHYGDYFIVSPVTIYIIWVVALILLLILPLLMARRAIKGNTNTIKL